jgi:signal peptidase I
MTPIQGKRNPLVIVNGEVMGNLIGPLLAEGRTCRFIAGGMSMYPFIRDLDCVTVEPLHKQSPKVGDVLAFFIGKPSTVVIHRVIDIRRGRYLMKGDNCPLPDGLIDKHRIGGILVNVERNGRIIYFGSGPERKIIGMISQNPQIMRLLRIPARIWDLYKQKTGR